MGVGRYMRSFITSIARIHILLCGMAKKIEWHSMLCLDSDVQALLPLAMSQHVGKIWLLLIPSCQVIGYE